MNDLALFTHNSTTELDDAMYPPNDPRPLLKLLMYASIFFSTPKRLAVPFPSCPTVKSPCASSNSKLQSNLLEISVISSSFAYSPSIENIPSVMMIFLWFLHLDIFFTRSWVSLCLYTWTLASLSLHPSIMLVWFNSSLNMMEFLSASTGIIPRFAMYPVGNTSADSCDLCAASFFSNLSNDTSFPETNLELD